MNYQYFSLAFGFFVWLVATLVFRFLGHTFFLVENGLLLAVLFLATIPLLYVLAKWVFNKYKLAGDTKLRSAVLMVTPGMVCDVACLKFHTIVFPQFTLTQSVVLGAWIIWVYVIVLLIGLMKSST